MLPAVTLPILSGALRRPRPSILTRQADVRHLGHLAMVVVVLMLFHVLQMMHVLPYECVWMLLLL